MGSVRLVDAPFPPRTGLWPHPQKLGRQLADGGPAGGMERHELTAEHVSSLMQWRLLVGAVLFALLNACVFLALITVLDERLGGQCHDASLIALQERHWQLYLGLGAFQLRVSRWIE